VIPQWDQPMAPLTRYLGMQGQLAVIQQLDLICLQVTQWVSRDQWMVDQADLVICRHRWMIWEKCILTWMMQQLMVQVIQDQEHQTLWPVTWMEMV
jgi:hypothetical protein